MNKNCAFCEISTGNASCHQIWEDDEHLAFLSIYPNTKALTVVITKEHYSSYAFDIPDDVLTGLIRACRKTAKLLDTAFEDVGRTGLIFEGFGVDHIHAKLIPMHGTGKLKGWKALKSNVDIYFEQYEGYLSSHDYKRAEDAELADLAKHIRKAKL